jgi:quinoprotein dehydrogenase-associated probable ABC transporter substrate-binding protein
MSSRCRELLRLSGALLCAALAIAPPAGAAQQRELRVCADPDNLPYSHRDRTGFEDRIAALLAEELGAQLRYAWQPLKRGFVRKTLGAGLCDVLIGVPADFERVLTTRPYYRSSYVFVYRAGAAGTIDSFTDPRLNAGRIGIQLVNDDLDATPPGYALARSGIVDNVVGYNVYGEGPAAERIIDALAAGRLDVALVWGPQAGYFAHRAAAPLAVTIAHRPQDMDVPRFEFDIALGVRRGDRALRDELDALLGRLRGRIDEILAAYDVPRTDRAGSVR